MAGPGKHYLFGGSNAKQARACGASVRMRQMYPDRQSSAAAEEGTRLHALTEHCLKNGEWDAGSYAGLWLEDENRAKVAALTKEQCADVSVVLEHVAGLMAEPGAELYVETQLRLEDIDPDAGGTGDVFVYTPNRGYCIDAKFGRTIVEVADNDQCFHYLAGWRRRFADLMPLDLTMTIVQPRAPHVDGAVRSYNTDMLALLEWEAAYAEAIKRAREPNCPAVPGDHCVFCPGTELGADGNYRCAAYGSRITAARDAAFSAISDPPLADEIDAATLGRMYSELSLLRKYIKDVETLVKARARTVLPEGYEWVPGGRDWSWRVAEGDVFDFVRVMHGDEIARELVRLVTPIQAEKSLPDFVIADIADMIEKSSAPPQLVKKGTRKTTLSLPEVQAAFAKSRDDVFDTID